MIEAYKEKNIDTLRVQERAMLCRSYFELRNYRAFSDCAQRWQSKRRVVNDKATGLSDAESPLMPRTDHGPVWVYDHFTMPLNSMRAAFALDVNQLGAAEQFAQRAIDQWQPQRLWPLSYHWSGELPDALLRAYKVLALVAIRQGEEARFQAQIKAIEALDIEYGRTGEGLAKRHFTLASLYIAQGDYVQAKTVMAQYDGRDPLFRVINLFSFNALDEVKQSLSEALSQNPYKLFMSAKIAFETGDHEQAEQLYQLFIELEAQKQLGISSLRATALYDLGRIRRGQGDAPAAERLLQQSIELLEQHRAALTSENSKIGFVSDKQSIYGEMVALLLARGDVERAFDYVERSKARSLVDILANKRSFKRRPTMDLVRYQQLVAQLKKAQARVEGGLNVEGAGADSAVNTGFDSISHGLSEIRKQETSARSRGATEMDSLVSVNALPLSKIREHLPEGHAILEYFGFRDQLHLFYLDHEHIEHRQLDGSGLQRRVQQFRKAILEPENKRYFAFSRQLYKQLFEPIRAQLGRSNLIVIPHGPIHYLPFNALHDGQQFLIDQYKLTTLSAANVMHYLGDNLRDVIPESDTATTDYSSLDPPQHSERKLFLLGNPDLNSPEWDLLGAEEEIRSIAKQYPGALLAAREHATESLVKEVGVHSDIIHIASHGEFLPETPLESRLLLAKDRKNDGRLTVEDAYDLSINADLVVLSACETGLGKIMNGADVIGLNRGFLFAGADTVVSSLWVVDDLATKELMVKFYQFQRQTSKSDSLRQAQLYIKNRFLEHPYYWSAFQFTGEI